MMCGERLSWGLVCIAAWLGALPGARAETDCAGLDVGETRYLRDDCQTDETLLVPDGFTLDGRGHRITAVDPPTAAFSGAVVRNAGASAHIRRLVIDAGELGVACHPASIANARGAALAAPLRQDAAARRSIRE